MAIPESGGINWYDINDTKSSSRLHIITGGDMSALATAMASISNAGITQVTNTTHTVLVIAPVDAIYKDARRDKAVFQCYCASTGEYLRISVPCPITTIFDDAQEEIDLTNIAVISLINVIKSTIVSNSGAPVTEVKKGWRA